LKFFAKYFSTEKKIEMDFQFISVYIIPIMSIKINNAKINYISKMEKEKSIKFMGTIKKVLDLLDHIKLQITDNEYLTIMNELKIEYDTKDDVFNIFDSLKKELLSNEIIALNNKRTNYVVKDFKLQLKSDKQKLDTGLFAICNKCNRVIANSFMSSHQQLDICRRFTRAKKLAVVCGTITTHARSSAMLIIDKLYSPVIMKLRLRNALG